MSNSQDVLAEIAAERSRQVEQEGWTPEHDDQHHAGELAAAAGCYALMAASGEAYGNTNVQMEHYRRSPAPREWPWHDVVDVSGGRGDCPVWGKAPAWWKPKNPRRDLIRAAALIVAEIERRDRAADRDAP
jgi:hypothetical protein